MTTEPPTESTPDYIGDDDWVWTKRMTPHILYDGPPVKPMPRWLEWTLIAWIGLSWAAIVLMAWAGFAR